MELTMRNLMSPGGEIDYAISSPAPTCCASGGDAVLISDYFEFYRLGSTCACYTKLPIGITMGVPTLIESVRREVLQQLEGGILESFGRLFRNDLKLYVYPLLDVASRHLVTVQKLRVAPGLQGLYDHLVENGYIESIDFYNRDYLRIFSRDVLDRIGGGDPSWETMVPATVAKLIKERGFFCYRRPDAPPIEADVAKQ